MSRQWKTNFGTDSVGTSGGVSPYDSTPRIWNADDQTAMVALSAARPGDLCLRADETLTAGIDVYRRLSAVDYSVATNWRLMIVGDVKDQVPLTQIAHYVGTTDPTVNNDSADTAVLGQTFRADSLWMNTSSRKLWRCFSASVGAAAWYVVAEFNTSGDQLFNKMTPRLIAFDDAVTIPAVGEIVTIVDDAADPTEVYGDSRGDGTTVRGKSIGSTAAIQSVVAAGTAYTLTATPALVDFGTTDPSLVLAGKVGTQYLLSGYVGIRAVGATFAANQVVTVKLRQATGVAADVTGGSRTIQTEIMTTFSGQIANLSLGNIQFQKTTEGDTIQIFASIDGLPSAGSVQVVEAFLSATPIKMN